MTSPETLKLVADPYPPYQYEEEGKVKGVDVEAITYVLKELGYEVQVDLLPWEECLHWMDNGRADGIFQLVRTPEREGHCIFSTLLRTAETVFLALNDQVLQINETIDLRKQLRPFRLGLLSGYSYDPIIDALDSRMKVEVPRQQELILGIKEKRFDLAIMDLGVANFLISKIGISGVKRVKDYTLARDLYVAFHSKHKELVSRFNKQLERFKAQGYYDKIMQCYTLKGGL